MLTQLDNMAQKHTILIKCLVDHERRIVVFVFAHERHHIGAVLVVTSVITVQLVGERTEQTVSNKSKENYA
jgi:hypothetical protein